MGLCRTEEEGSSIKEGLTNLPETHQKMSDFCRLMYRGADKSLSCPGMKEANVSVRIAWISFGALPCREILGDSSRLDVVEIARVAWYASQLVSFQVGLRTYQHPVNNPVMSSRYSPHSHPPMNIQQSDLPETSARAIQTAGTQSPPKPQHQSAVHRHTQRNAVP